MPRGRDHNDPHFRAGRHEGGIGNGLRLYVARDRLHEAKQSPVVGDVERLRLNARANPKAIGLEIIVSPLDPEEAVRHRMSWDKLVINEIVGVQNDQIWGPDQSCRGRAFYRSKFRETHKHSGAGIPIFIELAERSPTVARIKRGIDNAAELKMI